jgi:spermidine synthase
VHASVLDDAFDPLKTGRHRDRLSGTAALNTDDRPIAYLSNLLLWAEMQRSGMLQALIDHGRAIAPAVAALIAAAGVLAGLKRQAVPFTVFSAGLASMTVCVVVLLAYQSAYGSVYERVGFLTALFMAGSAAGAWAARDPRKPRAVLRACEAAAAVLLLAAPLFLRVELSYAVLMALSGGLAGAVFAAAANCGSGDAASRAGRLYGLDLAGSFLGALLAALALVPFFGIHATLLSMVVLKMFSLAILAAAGHEQA